MKNPLFYQYIDTKVLIIGFFLSKDHSKSQPNCPSNEAYVHVQNMAIGSDKAETLCIDSTVVNTLDVQNVSSLPRHTTAQVDR